MKILQKNMILKIMFVGFTSTICLGCQKFLDEKPDKKLAVPTTMEDFQSLLDDYNIMYNSPAAAEISTDDYYLTDADWGSLFYQSNKRMYTWEKDYLFSTDEPENDWLLVYRMVFRCNTVLDGLDKLGKIAANEQQRKNISGQAYYNRGCFLLQGAFIWAPAYDKHTAANELGLPIRLHTDFNEVSRRSNVEDTYAQIINDLKKAASLLPVIPLSKFRPSKAAAFGLLARAYLSMRDYPKAGLYADSCLQLNSSLMDYNTLNKAANFPILLNNIEVIVNQNLLGRDPLGSQVAKIKTELYNLYSENDLRKVIFFRKNTDGTYRFKGSYTQNNGLFSGVAVNEMFLIRAECSARAGKVENALNDLNTLVSKRWDKNYVYHPFSTNDENQALGFILSERRKELLMRGLRWGDVKRLNKEGADIKLTRMRDGKVLELLANDFRFALPLPEDVVQLSNMEPNPR